RKEPERRYASVAQFADDIRRHLDGLPVLARKDTWSYRASKFVARHKVPVAAAALVLLTLCGGIIATSWQAQRAEKARGLAQQRFDQVRQLARALMFEVHDSVADLPGSTPTRQLIVSRALEYLNNLAGESGDDPGLQRELASAYLKVGNVQGNPNNANLGDSAGALESYQKAKRIADQLLDENPGDAAARRQLGVILEKMCEVQAARGDLTGAIANAHRSLAAFKAIAERAPEDAAAQQSLAISHFKTGDVLGNPNFPNGGDPDGALRNYHAALHILQSLVSARDEFKTQRLLGVVHERLGTIFEAVRDFPEAEHHYSESRAIRLRLAEQHRDNTDVVRDAAIAHEKMANVQTAAGDLAAALENRRRSLEIFTRLADADPKNVLAQRSLGISYLHLAELLGSPESPNLDRRAEAIAHYERALEILSRTSEANDPKVRARIDLIQERLRALR
ncbi:MAG TPA: tetratricopeptide repeat protein, partial [Chthoniobacterales bacterium]|nr:tetratricopeptide repeat protein [Chthoniobacterales bacterium]